jgi:hypothetical protein
MRIRDQLSFCSLDSGWVKNQDPEPGSGSEMNITDHFSESSVKKIFGVKILKFIDADPDPGSGIFPRIQNLS